MIVKISFLFLFLFQLANILKAQENNSPLDSLNNRTIPNIESSTSDTFQIELKKKIFLIDQNIFSKNNMLVLKIDFLNTLNSIDSPYSWPYFSENEEIDIKKLQEVLREILSTDLWVHKAGDLGVYSKYLGIAQKVISILLGIYAINTFGF